MASFVLQNWIEAGGVRIDRNNLPSRPVLFVSTSTKSGETFARRRVEGGGGLTLGREPLVSPDY